ncbi:MAG: hypothetical protein WDN04_04125 [Rhodospirillales bacterium]
MGETGAGRGIEVDVYGNECQAALLQRRFEGGDGVGDVADDQFGEIGQPGAHLIRALHEEFAVLPDFRVVAVVVRDGQAGGVVETVDADIEVHGVAEECGGLTELEQAAAAGDTHFDGGEFSVAATDGLPNPERQAAGVVLAPDIEFTVAQRAADQPHVLAEFLVGFEILPGAVGGLERHVGPLR